MPLDATHLEILSEHYAHTFDFLQSYLKKRDKLFICVLILMFFMLFQIYTPDETSGIFTQVISNKFDLKTPLNFLYVQSFIWFILLSVSIKYFQSVVFIERQYNYIHALEKTLSFEYGNSAFTREGDSYLKDYPVFLNWASFLYTILFPSVLLLIITAKIIGEFKKYGFAEILIWFNASIYIFITVSISLYFYIIHFKKSKEHITNKFSGRKKRSH